MIPSTGIDRASPAMRAATTTNEDGTERAVGGSLFDGDAEHGAPSLEDVDDALLGVTVASEALDTVAAVSRSVRTEDIEAAFYLSELNHLASGASLTETTVMLLKNGLAFLDLITSPLGLLVPDTPAEAAGWTEWRHAEHGGYELRHQDEASWHTLEGTRIARDASAVDILAGHYVRRSAYRVGDSVITRRDGLVLSADGEFERRGDTLVTRGGDLVLSGRVHTSYSSWSSVDDVPRDAAERPLHDRYRLLEDGLTLEVTRADGTVDRRLGYRLGDGFVLDGKAYARGAGAASPSSPGDAAARRANGGAGSAWLALLAEVNEERERREGGRAALDPDVIAREAAARER